MLAATASDNKNFHAASFLCDIILFIDIKTDKQSDLLLNLFELSGKHILQKKITGSNQTVLMQNYKPAIYILKVTEGNKKIKTYQIVTH